MTSFTVRVELHGANNDDYQKLHAAMEKLGFVRWIVDRDGSKYRLPTAEYNMADTSLDKTEILRLATTASDSVKQNPRPSILVTASAGRTCSGLVPGRTRRPNPSQSGVMNE